MKTFKLLLLAIICTLFFTACTLIVTPKADQEAVLTYQPAFFGHGGVDETPISSGSEWIAPTTSHMLFQITPMTITEEFTNMILADNTPVSFAVYLKVQIQKGKSPLLYKNFSKDWYINSMQPTLRTIVRDKACIFKMFDLASKREISAQLEKDIFTYMSEYAKKINIPVEILQISIGAITLPDQVLTEIKNTAAQNQSMLTQVARAKAELSRKQAEINKAKADKAYQREMNMSIEQYLHLRQLEIEKENVSIIFGESIPFSYPVH